MIIDTDLIIIRVFIIDVLYAFAAIMADPEVMRFSIHGPQTRIQVEELINKIIPQNIRSIAVAKRVGMVYWKESVFYDIPVHIYVLLKGFGL